jgi:tetratricopeptide (TPR) repeat protein
MKKKLLLFGLMVLVISTLTGCNSAGKYGKDGKKYFSQGKYEEAADSFVKAINQNPNRTDYYIDYGLTLTALGRYEDAITQFDEAYRDKDIVIIKKNNKKLLRGKGIAYFYSRQYEKALEQFELALQIRELSELNRDILYYKGSSLRAIGSYDLAAEAYSTILSEEKKHVPALLERAYCYRILGDDENSLKDYEQVTSLEPDNYDGYFGKYSVLLECGRETDGVETLEQAAAIGGETLEDRFNQAKLHYYQGDIETALTELEESYSEGFSEAYLYVGEIYRKKKNYPKAVYYYEAFLSEEKDPGLAVYNQLGYCLMKQGNHIKAIEYLDTGLAMSPTGAMKGLKKNEIIAYEGMGEFATALEKLREYLKVYPQDSKAAREKAFLETRTEVKESREGEER